MPNPHLHNISRSAYSYRGLAGVTPTPQVPWNQRRLALIEKINSRGETGLVVNLKYTLKTNTNEGTSKDIRRLISEGFAVMTHKTGKPLALDNRKRKGGKEHKSLLLTEKGRALLPSAAPEATPGPYAKRKLAMAEFLQAQRI